MSRPDHPNSPLLSSPKPAPSPVLFPPSPFSSPNLASANAPPVLPMTQLALAALDTLLCALVDRPKNMRKFEEIGGLPAIVKVLKDKNVPQAVRIKVVELLYYYLLPEANNPLSPGPPSPDSSFSSLARSTLRRFRPSNACQAEVSVVDTARSARAFLAIWPVLLLRFFSRLIPDAHSTPSNALSIAEHGFALYLDSDADSGSTSFRTRSHASTLSRRFFLLFTPRPVLSTASIAATVYDSGGRRVINPPSKPGIPAVGSDILVQQLLPSAFASTIDTPAGTVNHITLLVPPSLVIDSKDADAEDMPPPRRPRPVSFIAPASPAAAERTARHSRSRSSVDLASFAATTGTSSSSGSASSSSSRSTAPTSIASSAPSPTLDARPRHVRTEQEKKELLRKVMPNVEALEDRFRAMGLGLS
ncbi:Proteophosphoglycan ppg4 [Rhodotorula toruloides ATCC 204091]|uniref:Proteophosphoglycan ppg4 n=1 Tax=Rhodotorula toruloides TaxID=5286 RepID=A0A2T0A5L8_RHOTO|nr:Proteophosphoglycan ppg4 [Rhodotorula toruloides ATCC 204091]PRQ73307.1 Proteophosphoglycan ppg4 [Rhodotorula toruloides]